jgi:hypothetical protein
MKAMLQMTKLDIAALQRAYGKESDHRPQKNAVSF